MNPTYYQARHDVMASYFDEHGPQDAATAQRAFELCWAKLDTATVFAASQGGRQKEMSLRQIKRDVYNQIRKEQSVGFFDVMTLWTIGRIVWFILQIVWEYKRDRMAT